jgi:hypothetical protein
MNHSLQCRRKATVTLQPTKQTNKMRVWLPSNGRSLSHKPARAAGITACATITNISSTNITSSSVVQTALVQVVPVRSQQADKINNLMASVNRRINSRAMSPLGK